MEEDSYIKEVLSSFDRDFFIAIGQLSIIFGTIILICTLFNVVFG